MSKLPISAPVALLGLMASLAVASCSLPDNESSAYAPLPAEGWKYGDTITLTPVHRDSICRGRLVVGVRHGNDYPYGSLWLEVSYTDADRPVTDTVELRLTDRFGSWTGRGIGASFQQTDTLPRLFTHTTGAPVKLRHIMRADTLPAVEQLGVFFLPNP